MAMIEVSHLNFTHEGGDQPVSGRIPPAGHPLEARVHRPQRPGQDHLFAAFDGPVCLRRGDRLPGGFRLFPLRAWGSGNGKGGGAVHLSGGGELGLLYRELDKLELSDGVLDRPLATLSPGERTRLMLAALFLKENFLLIDEPTNHLDMEARRAVSRYLSGKSGFILVSHDRTFLDGCVDHVLSINRADIEVQKGNFSSWAENRRRQDEYELNRQAALRKDIGRAHPVGPPGGGLVRAGGGTEAGHRRGPAGPGLSGPQGGEDDEAGEGH